MKKLIIALLIIAFSSSTAFGGEWIQYTLIQKPYYDRYGNELTDDQVNRRNNNWQQHQEFFRDGAFRPSLPHMVIREFEQENTLLVEYDITGIQAAEIVAKTDFRENVSTHKIRRHSAGITKLFPKEIRKINFRDFRPIRLTQDQAEILLISWGIYIRPASGVSE